MSVPLLDVPGTNSALSQAEAIEALLARLDAAARQQTDATAFYQQMLHELVGALSAVSAAVWCESDRGLDCLERVGSGTSSQEELPEDAERRLAATVLLGGETRLIAPGAMLPGSEQRNDSGRLQCLSPRAADGVPGLVLRLSLRPDVTLGARETASGVLDAAAEMALAFQLQHRLRWLHQQEEFWSRLDSAILQMNSSPKYSAATRAIAEQVRWLLGCDRVSLLVRRGSRCRIAAISSAAESDRRARQVRLVEQLATDAVNGAGEFEVQVGSGTSPLRVSDSVDAYFDETQLRTVRCTPLQLANDRQSRPIGCLVIDSYSAAPTEVWQKTLDVLGPHCAQTLERGLQEQSRGWRRLLSPWRSFSRTAAWGALFAAMSAAVVALVVVPADFTVEADGRLMPTDRRGVFAPADAIVTELLVTDGSLVQEGDPLVELIDADLELERSRLQGELQTAAAQLDAVQARRKLRLRDRDTDASLLSIEEEELKAKVGGLQNQLEIVEQQRTRLTVASPIAGRVARWDLKETLQSLPVRHGQRLMDVYRPDGGWRLELDIPDDVAGYVRLAATDGPPGVEYVFQTDPGRIASATLDRLADATDLSSDGQLTVRGIVDLPQDQSQTPQRGASVTAKIHCGRRSLGFVWFREMIEFVQRRILF